MFSFRTLQSDASLVAEEKYSEYTLVEALCDEWR